MRRGASLREDLAPLPPGAAGCQGGRYSDDEGWSAMRSDRSGLGRPHRRVGPPALRPWPVHLRAHSP